MDETKNNINNNSKKTDLSTSLETLVFMKSSFFVLFSGNNDSVPDFGWSPCVRTVADERRVAASGLMQVDVGIIREGPQVVRLICP